MGGVAGRYELRVRSLRMGGGDLLRGLFGRLRIGRRGMLV